MGTVEKMAGGWRKEKEACRSGKILTTQERGEGRKKKKKKKHYTHAGRCLHCLEGLLLSRACCWLLLLLLQRGSGNRNLRNHCLRRVTITHTSVAKSRERSEGISHYSLEYTSEKTRIRDTDRENRGQQILHEGRLGFPSCL